MLMRLKALQGDGQPEIPGDCSGGLMAISPERSLRFVERFLSADAPEVAEEAALALGNSRLPQAFALLQHCRERSAISAFKRRLLLSIDLPRCEEAFRLLRAVVRDEHPDSAAAAVKALSICGDNPERRELIREAALARNSQAVAAAHEKEFARADT